MGRSLAGAVIGGLLLVGAGQGEAASRSEVRKQTELSMRVTGKIHIDAAGNVTSQRIDQPDKLLPEVRDLVARAASNWKFEPKRINGKAVASDATMAVRVVARPTDNRQYEMRIPAVSFGYDVTPQAGEEITAVDMSPPLYPDAAVRAGVTGTVFLLLRVGRDGTVLDVAEEQTNLKVAGNTREMDFARKLLANASIRQARRWTFNVPTRDDAAKEQSWKVRVPIDFAGEAPRHGPASGGRAEPPYGEWEAYIPGPRHRIPWLSEEEAAEASRQSPEALAGGSVNMLGHGPRLNDGKDNTTGGG